MKTILSFVLIGSLAAGAFAEDVLDPPSTVTCANLIYGAKKTSKCFSNNFLKEVGATTHIKTRPEFIPIPAEDMDLFCYPFSIMSGEGTFQLTATQRDNLRSYLMSGGFLLASAGCSSKQWQTSFSQEFSQLFPDRKLVKLSQDHPIFHTVSDVAKSRYKSGATRFPDLYGLEIDGRICLVYSPDGLNDTANAKQSGCCCCGGNEVKAAQWINMNLLAFALTH